MGRRPPACLLVAISLLTGLALPGGAAAGVADQVDLPPLHVPPLPPLTDDPSLPSPPAVPAAPALGAQTMYVDRESRGGPCSDNRSAVEAQSPSAPWCTIERAAAAAPPGSLVLVRDGRYPRFDIRSQRQGDLTFRPRPGESPVMRGGTMREGNVRVEGFRITGQVMLESGVSHVAFVSNDWVTNGRTGGTNVNMKAGVKDVLIEGNRLAQRRAVRSANVVNFSSTDTRAPIEDVAIRGNRIGPVRGGGDAIQAKNTRRLSIEGNEIFGISRPKRSGAHPDAIQSIFGSSDLVIRGNFIHDIASQGVFIQTYSGENRSFHAEDNVIARVAYPWTAFAFRAKGAYVAHNTIGGRLRLAGTAVYAIANIASSSLTVGDRSQLTGEDYSLSRRYLQPRGRNSILGAPRFVAPGSNDFTLRSDSPGKRAAPDGSDLGSRTTVFRAR